jgi:hypothetical protein
LNYLTQERIQGMQATLSACAASEFLPATFFVVGSRVIERPAVLVEEYMGGHEISVHTWSHQVSITAVLFLYLSSDAFGSL